MQLIEGSNQMELIFMIVFVSKSNDLGILLPINIFLYSLNDYICFVISVVNCSWFGFNAIVVTHLFELAFEFGNNLILKDNQLRLWVWCQCQPCVIKQILNDAADLFVASTI
jgi:hypothetical protein